MDAFNAFNFEKDERWHQYLKTVELPSGDVGAAMLRLKARWYKRTIDPSFDAASVGAPPKATSGSAPSRPAGGANTTNSSTGTNTNTTNSSTGGSGAGYAAYGRAPPPPPPPRYGSGSGTYGSSTAQRRLFLMHVGMLVLGVVAIVPLLPYGRTAYLYLMRLTILTFGYKIYLQHGLPSFRPLSMAMAWVQRVLPTSDFMQLIVALSFSAHPPMTLVAAPPLVLAAYHTAAYGAAHLGGHPLWQRYGSRVHAVMLRRQPDALLLNAFCEVATGFFLVLQLLSPARSLLTLLFYTQILKLKLHVPDSAAHHRQVWRKLDEVTLPYRRRLPPVVERGIQLAAGWFTRVPGA